TLGQAGRFFHFGLTSSDILDTATALQLRQAGFLLLKDLNALQKVIREKAWQYRHLPMIGRTHGIHAEPITLGFKLAGWYFEVKRNISRLKNAIAEISVGKLSGAVGTYSNIPPEVEQYACECLQLKPESFSTQIIPRDRHAVFLSVLGLIAASAERVALQIRLLQQTELAELAEPFQKGQKGSSAMPHKRNPVLTERICGLARVIKKNVAVSLDNIALWHERDISHSSAERLIFPESTILLDYILTLLTSILEKLEVFPEHLERNLQHTRGLIFSQAVLSRLIEKGLSRVTAYEIVQRYAFQTVKEKSDFLTVLKNAPEIKEILPATELEECFQSRKFLRHLDQLFLLLEKEKD
ncbi:MAG TPA: adenylosuccinate lyase, partial [bacterium]|nr:adenylosuccinate lyase [bacterium]